MSKQVMRLTIERGPEYGPTLQRRSIAVEFLGTADEVVLREGYEHVEREIMEAAQNAMDYAAELVEQTMVNRNEAAIA